MTEAKVFAKVVLQDVDDTDSIAERTVVFTDPHWSIQIGRGTMSGEEGLQPAEENTWFDSRVMSRNHAILSADLASRAFMITDTGSMHGTLLNGERLLPHIPATLHDRDTLVFGADVTRGSSHFRALKVMVAFSWSDEVNPNPNNASSPPFRNTFSADYSEEEIYDEVPEEDHDEVEVLISSADVDASVNDLETKADATTKRHKIGGDWPELSESDYVDDDADADGDDDDVQIIKESFRAHSVEVVIPILNILEPGVIASEESEGSSYLSDAEVGESPTSSPQMDSPRQEPKRLPARPSSSDPVPEIAEPQTETYSYSHPFDMELNNSVSDDEENRLEPQHDHSGDRLYSMDAYLRPSTSGLGIGTRSPTRAQALDTARAPSPSDAAMAKAPAQFSMAPPFLQQIPGNHQVQQLLPPDSANRESSAWAGHNAILYEPLPNQPYLPRDETLQGFHNIQSPHIFDNARHESQVGGEPQQSLLNSGPPSLPPRLPKPRPSRFSIADLLDQPNNNSDGSGSKANNSLKRKADKISPEGQRPDWGYNSITANNGTDRGPAQNEEVVLRTACGDILDFDTLPGPATIQATQDASSRDKEQPPRKKLKRSKVRSKDGGSLVKMTAAAIAGVAIGAVGTIIGLASLPQDYFV